MLSYRKVKRKDEALGWIGGGLKKILLLTKGHHHHERLRMVMRMVRVMIKMIIAWLEDKIMQDNPRPIFPEVKQTLCFFPNWMNHGDDVCAGGGNEKTICWEQPRTLLKAGAGEALAETSSWSSTLTWRPSTWPSWWSPSLLSLSSYFCISTEQLLKSKTEPYISEERELWWDEHQSSQKITKYCCSCWFSPWIWFNSCLCIWYYRKI